MSKQTICRCYLPVNEAKHFFWHLKQLPCYCSCFKGKWLEKIFHQCFPLANPQSQYIYLLSQGLKLSYNYFFSANPKILVLCKTSSNMMYCGTIPTSKIRLQEYRSFINCFYFFSKQVVAITYIKWKMLVLL